MATVKQNNSSQFKKTLASRLPLCSVPLANITTRNKNLSASRLPTNRLANYAPIGKSCYPVSSSLKKPALAHRTPPTKNSLASSLSSDTDTQASQSKSSRNSSISTIASRTGAQSTCQSSPGTTNITKSRYLHGPRTIERASDLDARHSARLKEKNSDAHSKITLLSPETETESSSNCSISLSTSLSSEDKYQSCLSKLENELKCERDKNEVLTNKLKNVMPNIAKSLDLLTNRLEQLTVLIEMKDEKIAQLESLLLDEREKNNRICSDNQTVSSASGHDIGSYAEYKSSSSSNSESDNTDNNSGNGSDNSCASEDSKTNNSNNNKVDLLCSKTYEHLFAGIDFEKIRSRLSRGDNSKNEDQDEVDDKIIENKENGKICLSKLAAEETCESFETCLDSSSKLNTTIQFDTSTEDNSSKLSSDSISPCTPLNFKSTSSNSNNNGSISIYNSFQSKDDDNMKTEEFGSLQEASELIKQLKRQLIEKERQLIDTRLEALNAAHQLQEMEDSWMAINIR